MKHIIFLMVLWSGILVGCRDITVTTAEPTDTRSTEVSADTEVTEEFLLGEADVENATENAVVESAESVTEETDVEETTKIEEPESPPAVCNIEADIRGTHYIGDSLSASDFTVTVTMTDGTVMKNPAGWCAEPLYLSTSETVITVTYQGVSTAVTVYADEKPTRATTDAPTEATTEAAPPASSEVPTVPQTQTPPETPESPAPTTQAPTTPQIDRGMAEAAWNIQKDIIAREGMSEETWEHTGSNIQWSESLYQLCCRRVMEITTDFSHAGAPDFAAENIAKWCYDADEVVEGWYNSPGHKQNMLAGWYYGAIAYYDGHWVALFAMHE